MKVPEDPEGYITMTEAMVEIIHLMERIPTVASEAQELSRRVTLSRKHLIRVREWIESAKVQQ